MDWQLILQAINTIGTVGALTIFIWLFWKGEIISRVTHDRVLGFYEKQNEAFWIRLKELIDAMLSRIEHKIERAKDEVISLNKNTRRKK